MSEDDWYRNTHWNQKIEDAFFTKLRRARSQRDQYLVIQALTIAPHKPDIALRLVDQYFDTRTQYYDTTRAMCARAEAYLALDEIENAIATYKDILSYESEHPNQTSGVRITLSYLIATKKVQQEYDFGLELLDKCGDEFAFPISKFKWFASCALILEDMGMPNEAKKHAKNAIKIAGIRKTGLRYHQDLGLVGKNENEIVKAMYRIGA